MLGCIVSAKNIMKSNPVSSDSALSALSSSSKANPTLKRALLRDQSLTTNEPLVLQSSSSLSSSSPSSGSSKSNSNSSSGSSRSTSTSATNRELLVIQQSFTQTLQILNQSEFNNEELTRYELLMSSYTDNFGYNVSIPYILPSCRVTSQSLVSFLGTEESQQVHVLTVELTMGYYDSRYYDDYDIDNYPMLFQEYINSHLGVVTKDMRDRWILPVVVAQAVEVLGDDAVAAATGSTALSDAPTNSPVAAQVAVREEDTDDAALLSGADAPSAVVAATPTNAPSTRMYSSSTHQISDTSSSSSSKSSPRPTATPSISSPQHSTTDQAHQNSSSSSSSSSPPYSSQPKQTYHVQSTMILESVSHQMLDGNGELDPNAQEAWIQVTQDWIHDATVQFVGSDIGNHGAISSDVAAILSLDQYKILDGDDDVSARDRSRALARRMRSVPSPLKQFYLRRRGLVSETVPSPASLRLEFTSTLSFNSSKENWNANEILASGFRSVEQQTEYIDALKNQPYWNQNDISFDSMAMEVDGKLITDKVNAPPPTTDSAIASNQSAAVTAESETSDGRAILFGLKNIYFYAMIIAVVCILLLLAIFIYRKRARNIGSKKVSNTQEVEGENDAALPINEVGKFARSDDSSEIETPNRITVVAPSGKLGLVVSSSPNTDTMPMIVQIKNKSLLTGKAKVGDSLLSVDEVDCRGMTALEVSNLISSRCQNPERVFVLFREM